MPHKPGVYLMRDRFNRVIYVGKARDLRKRVSSYFLPSKLAQADLKTRAMLDATWDFETHTVRSEAESVLLEGKLIKEYRPRYNISFRDDKRFLLVKVDLSEEWPRFRLTRLKKGDSSRYFEIHHTAADTLDKINPQDVSLCVAAMAVMIYTVADMPQGLK